MGMSHLLSGNLLNDLATTVRLKIDVLKLVHLETFAVVFVLLLSFFARKLYPMLSKYVEHPEISYWIVSVEGNNVDSVAVNNLMYYSLLYLP